MSISVQIQHFPPEVSRENWVPKKFPTPVKPLSNSALLEALFEEDLRNEEDPPLESDWHVASMVLLLDIMEEFRPFLADRLTLSLINLGQVKRNGFRKKESGAVLMDEDSRKTVLVAYQKRKQNEIIHPFLGEKVPIGTLFYIQALLLARYMRGD